ncbi:uncharacterized protein LOC131937885 [Physella acuta]|uniref:uncharacterized protein LOC131937885 n=1 Tax=Physella acuta TaxID=109671 RepID=UPI0027DBAB8B|nr:uncharacterized protein LOC131937885 [Physella acuta]
MLAYHKAPTFGWLKSRGHFGSRDGSLILVALLFILPCVAASPLFNSFRHREVRHASITRHSRQAADINSVIQTIQSVLDKDNSTGIAASELKDLAASVGDTGRAILGSDASVTDADVSSVISTLIGSYNISYDDSKSSAVKKYGHKLQQYLYIWRSLSDRITLLQGSGQNYNLELAAVVKTSNDIQAALVQSVNSVSVLSSKFNKTRRAIRRKLYSRQGWY